MIKIETKQRKQGTNEAEEFEIHGDEFPAVTEALNRIRTPRRMRKQDGNDRCTNN